MPKIESFEKYSDAYDEWFEQHCDVYQAELDAIRQLMPSHEFQGLEVGIGTAKFALPLGVKIGVDPSEQMAIKARKRGVEVHLGVAEDLPFSGRQFDVVLMVTTICFVDDVIKSFDEAFRVLNSGGCIIVAFVDKESALGQHYSAKREKSTFYKDATFYSAQEVVNYLEAVGFGIQGIKQTLMPGESQQTIVDGYGKGGFVVIKGVK